MDCIAGTAINPCPSSLTGPACQLFLALINTLIGSQCGLSPEGRYPPDHGQLLKDGDEFDFIVVGAGSAGSVVANRLSELPEWKVLLLEAGNYPSALTEIPALAFGIIDTSEDWQYVMEPSETCCLGLKGNICPCPKGKAIGGTSSIHSHIYLRGNRRDFDSWAEAGNTGWNFDSIVKYFKKFENTQHQKSHQYGRDGELALSHYVDDQPIRQILENAYKELGYKEYKEDKPLGFVNTFITTSQGTRVSTGKAFIEKIKDRKNLKVAVNAQVGRLLIDKKTKAVNGLEVKINNKIIQVKAKKEVILSAGSINSPQVLMNSGIGPKEHLESLGIEILNDLRVGENMQDHLLLTMYLAIDNAALKTKTELDVTDELYDYFMHRQGPLSQIGITNFIGYVNTRNNSVFPNLQILHMAHYPNDQLLLPDFVNAFRLPEEVTTVLVEHNKNTSILMLAPTLLKPKSRGKMLLRSPDPFEKPMIYPNYLSDSGNDDLQVLLEGVQLVQKLMQTSAFDKTKPKLIEFKLRKCKDFNFATDDYWKCMIRNIACNEYRQLGTCKMGPVTDPNAVVDPRLRVHGIKGVRVADGSIMPIISSAPTNAAIIMIGEKAADLIKEDWLQRHDEL